MLGGRERIFFFLICTVHGERVKGWVDNEDYGLTKWTAILYRMQLLNAIRTLLSIAAAFHARDAYFF